jgi:hypothetical protein
MLGYALKNMKKFKSHVCTPFRENDKLDFLFHEVVAPCHTFYRVSKLPLFDESLDFIFS